MLTINNRRYLNRLWISFFAVALVMTPFLFSWAAMLNVCFRYNDPSYTARIPTPAYPPYSSFLATVNNFGLDNILGTTDDNIVVPISSTSIDTAGCTSVVVSSVSGAHYVWAARSMTLPNGDFTSTNISLLGKSPSFVLEASNSSATINSTVILNQIDWAEVQNAPPTQIAYSQPTDPALMTLFVAIGENSLAEPPINTAEGPVIFQRVLARQVQIGVQKIHLGTQQVTASVVNTGSDGFIATTWDDHYRLEFNASHILPVAGEEGTYLAFFRSEGSMVFNSRPTDGSSATFFLNKFSVGTAP